MSMPKKMQSSAGSGRLIAYRFHKTLRMINTTSVKKTGSSSALALAAVKKRFSASTPRVGGNGRTMKLATAIVGVGLSAVLVFGQQW
jgi:hypothetical protein